MTIPLNGHLQEGNNCWTDKSQPICGLVSPLAFASQPICHAHALGPAK